MVFLSIRVVGEKAFKSNLMVSKSPKSRNTVKEIS
jgi:hypothetical protein